MIKEIKDYFHILHEIHEKGKSSWNDDWDSCECSYCKGTSKLDWGFNIPGLIGPTSWWVFKYDEHKYIRFVLPFLKRKKRDN